jgi:O-antigen/teichoic acid export membrane protein
MKLIVLFNCSLFAYAMLMEWYFQGKEAMQMVSIGKTVTAAVYLFIVFSFVKSGSDILWVGVAAIAGDFAMMFFYAGMFSKEGGSLQPRLDTRSWRTMLGQSIPLGLGTVLSQVSVNLAPLVLAVVLSNVEVGLYSAASKLVFFLLMVDRVLGVMLLPATARLQSESPDRVSSQLARALKWIVIAALPICVGGMIVSEKIVQVVYGSQFQTAADLFRILIWYLALTMIHTVYTSALIAVAPSSLYGKVMAVSATVYAASIILLTVFFGVYGSVVGVVVSEGITLLIARAALQPHLQIPSRIKFLKITMALSVMIGVLLFIPTRNLLMEVALGGVVYAGMLLGTKVFSLEELGELLWRDTA